MLYDELYEMTDKKMVSKLGSYADSALYPTGKIPIK
jgi:hypothetical protein